MSIKNGSIFLCFSFVFVFLVSLTLTTFAQRPNQGRRTSPQKNLNRQSSINTTNSVTVSNPADLNYSDSLNNVHVRNGRRIVPLPIPPEFVNPQQQLVDGGDNKLSPDLKISPTADSSKFRNMTLRQKTIVSTTIDHLNSASLPPNADRIAYFQEMNQGLNLEIIGWTGMLQAIHSEDQALFADIRVQSKLKGTSDSAWVLERYKITENSLDFVGVVDRSTGQRIFHGL